MDDISKIIENYDSLHNNIRGLFAAPLVHVAVCGGVAPEERALLAPFVQDFIDAANILLIQVSEESYRQEMINQLSTFLSTLDKAEALNIKRVLKDRCMKVAEAVMEQGGEPGERISPEENRALDELKKMLAW